MAEIFLETYCCIIESSCLLSQTGAQSDTSEGR